jgi:hypothetical protein
MCCFSFSNAERPTFQLEVSKFDARPEAGTEIDLRARFNLRQGLP